MDKLQGAELRSACTVIHERYSRCVSETVKKDVLGSLDLGATNRKCGALFADLTDFCAEFIRTGELQQKQQKR